MALKDIQEEAEIQKEAAVAAGKYVDANKLMSKPIVERNLIANAVAHGFYMGVKAERAKAKKNEGN